MRFQATPTATSHPTACVRVTRAADGLAQPARRGRQSPHGHFRGSRCFKETQGAASHNIFSKQVLHFHILLGLLGLLSSFFSGLFIWVCTCFNILKIAYLEILPFLLCRTQKENGAFLKSQITLCHIVTNRTFPREQSITTVRGCPDARSATRGKQKFSSLYLLFRTRP